MYDTELAIADSIAEQYAGMLDLLIQKIDAHAERNSSLKAANHELRERIASLERAVAAKQDVAMEDVLAREAEMDAMAAVMQRLKQENKSLRAEAAGLRQENDALTVDSSLETIPLKRFKPCKLPKKYHKAPNVLAMKRLIAAGKITDWEPGRCGDQLAARVSFPGGFGHTDVARDGSTHEDLAREQVGSIKQRLGLP